LLAWIITESPVTEGPVTEARLVDAAGKVVARTRCFDASTMLQDDPTSIMSGTDRGLFGALMALSPELPPGAYSLVVDGFVGTAEGFSTASIAIGPRSFSRETIHLDEANARIRAERSKRKDDEARKLYALLSSVDEAAIYAGPAPFIFPVEGGWRSAGFGDVRRYAYPSGGSDRSVHNGIDWAVVEGTAVSACARGKVVMVADREVTGKTLIVEHLPGLYSLYFHLSEIEVEEGAIVDRGERIALSGSTGMATGPHLHWELRAKGGAVDPEYWLQAALLDKNAVSAIMSGLIEGR
jgi:murein DD-endopeptidase MepM/ murein hydrolase activator NlpD